MTARFAGSQDLAQRRRRRLAQEASESSFTSGSGRSSRQTVESNSGIPSGTGSFYSGPRLPRDTMIPGSWKIISALGVLGFIAWGVVIWLSVSSWSERMGIANLVSLSEGSVPRYFSTVALLFTAQLSLLIYWHRSRSRKDFLGRYRIWGWAGLFWCMVCLANATRIHWPPLQYLATHVFIDCWRGEHLFWFVPLAICMLALYRLVGRDVNPSPQSTIAWNIAFGLGMLVAGLHFGLELLLPQAWRIPVTVSVTMLWHYSLAMFCLIHARYVTHVTNEAGGKRLTIHSRVSRRMASQLTLLGERVLQVRVPIRRWSMKRNSAKAEIKADATKGPKKAKSVAVQNAPAPIAAPKKSVETPAASPSWGQRLRQSVASRWTRRVDPALPPEATVAPPHVPIQKPKPERSQAAAATVVAAPPAKPTPPPSKPAVQPALPAALKREDEDADDDDNGMSSRERKRQKKLQRQQSR